MWKVWTHGFQQLFSNISAVLESQIKKYKEVFIEACRQVGHLSINKVVLIFFLIKESSKEFNFYQYNNYLFLNINKIVLLKLCDFSRFSEQNCISGMSLAIYLLGALYLVCTNIMDKNLTVFQAQKLDDHLSQFLGEEAQQAPVETCTLTFPQYLH